MLNFTLSVLVHKGILKLDEAEHLAKELAQKTQPQNFLEAHKIVEQVVKEFAKKK